MREPCFEVDIGATRVSLNRHGDDIRGFAFAGFEGATSASDLLARRATFLAPARLFPFAAVGCAPLPIPDFRQVLVELVDVLLVLDRTATALRPHWKTHESCGSDEPINGRKDD